MTKRPFSRFSAKMVQIGDLIINFNRIITVEKVDEDTVHLLIDDYSEFDGEGKNRLMVVRGESATKLWEFCRSSAFSCNPVQD